MGKIRNSASGSSVASEGGARRQGAGRKARLLSVASFTKRKPRSSEKSFEKKFYGALTDCGYPNWHVTMREAGWPDRYAKGGHWFELKSLKELGDVSQLSTEQVRHLNMLSKAGDKCFYVAKWENSVIFLPWFAFRDLCDQSPAKAVELGYRYAYKNKTDLKNIICWHI